MSTRLLILIVALLALAVGLAATNPSWPDYLRFLDGFLNQAAGEAGGRSDVATALLQNKAVIEAVLRSQTLRRDYGLFSLFETNLWDVQFVVLGIGGQFIPLEGLEQAKKKLQRAKPPPPAAR